MNMDGMDEIIQQFMNFFFAGMDTTGTTAGFYALAKYPDVY